MKQSSFASLSFDVKKKPTRREKFLGEMDKVVPSADLLAVIEPSYSPRAADAAIGDAADPLHATVVHVERPGDGKCAVCARVGVRT